MSVTLHGERVTLRPVAPEDTSPLVTILAEPSVREWWGDAPSLDDSPAFTIEVAGEIAGAIQYWEEDDPMYRHAGIDVFLGSAFQGRGLGADAVRTLARHLFDDLGHHRLTIDPAASNERAIRSYERVGFRRIGVLRQYERGPDGRWRDGLLMDLLRGEILEPDERM